MAKRGSNKRAPTQAEIKELKKGLVVVMEHNQKVLLMHKNDIGEDEPLYAMQWTPDQGYSDWRDLQVWWKWLVYWEWVEPPRPWKEPSE